MNQDGIKMSCFVHKTIFKWNRLQKKSKILQWGLPFIRIVFPWRLTKEKPIFIDSVSKFCSIIADRGLTTILRNWAEYRRIEQTDNKAQFTKFTTKKLGKRPFFYATQNYVHAVYRRAFVEYPRWMLRAPWHLDIVTTLWVQYYTFKYKAFTSTWEFSLSR